MVGHKDDGKPIYRSVFASKQSELMPKLNEVLMCWENCITNDLSEEERDLLTSLLMKMKSRAGLYMEDR